MHVTSIPKPECNSCRDPVGSNWLVYTGAHDLTKLERSRARYSVERVILHERFDLSNFDNDIALLKLTTPVHWDTFVKPVCVPPPHYQLQAGTICTITGWGMAGGCTVLILPPNIIAPLPISFPLSVLRHHPTILPLHHYMC